METSKTTQIPTTKKPTGTSILRCSCKHAAQDEIHGSGMRVHNACRKGTGIGYRCSVCGNVK